MKLTERVYLVGSGLHGMGLTDDYDCHVYLINGGDALALIDAGSGMGVEQIIDNICLEGFEPQCVEYLFITHAHSDHAGGAAKFREALGCRIVAPAADADLIRNPDEGELGLVIARRNGFYPPDYHFPACEVDLEVVHEQAVRVGGLEIRAIHTPGHCTGATCFLLDAGGKRLLFSTDVVFFNGLIGLLNCPRSSLEEYREHIGRLAGLKVEALLPGHLGLTLSNGQFHINKAIEAFKGLTPPPNAI